MPEKKKIKKESKNKIEEKKVLPTEEVVSFSDLANKYQKKLDNLLGIESTVAEVDDVLDDYVEDVERLFVVDQDNDEHRIIKLSQKKKKSPYVLDLSKVKDSQAVDLEKAARLYDKLENRKKELRAKSKKIQTVKVKPSIKKKKKINKVKLSDINAKTKKKKVSISKNKVERQRVEFSYWRYWWYRNARYFRFYLKGLAFTLLFMFALVVFLVSNMKYISDALIYGEEAVLSLESIKTDLLKQDWKAVENKIDFSTRSLLLAEGKLQQVNPLMDWALHLSPYVGQKYRAIKHLLNGSVNLGLGARTIVNLLDDNFLLAGEIELSDKVEDFLDGMQGVNYFFEQANYHFSNIDVAYFPAEYGDKLLELKNILPRILKVNAYLLNNRDDILDLLGHDYPRRYLLLFQNDKEIRPTGGFMGSIAFVDVAGGEISNIEVPGGGPYDYQGGMDKFLMSPVPLQLINSRWYLQDSNWFSDYPHSAQKVLWFLEESGGPSADAVIAVNFTVLEDLLRITGPIYLEDYGLTLNSTNLWIELQKEVELNYDREENQPKAIIGDLFLILEDKIMNSSINFKQKVLQQLLANLWHKDILAYSKNEKIQNLLEAYNFAGKIQETDGDYLMLVNANVGGSKTDAVIKQTIDHQLVMEEDGTLLATVEITREHNGERGSLFTGNPNVNYMQLYVPEGSELIAAYGFSQPAEISFKDVEDYYEVDDDLSDLYANMKVDEFSKTNIHNEFGKTVFSNWTITEPGESTKVTFMYKLPFNFYDLGKVENYNYYSFYMQKQPGMKNTTVTNSFIFGDGKEIKWSSPEIDLNTYNYEFLSDKEFNLLIKD